ncbi:hypothetical protein SprV_0100290400 [Sparganum proliferum]
MLVRAADIGALKVEDEKEEEEEEEEEEYQEEQEQEEWWFRRRSESVGGVRNKGVVDRGVMIGAVRVLPLIRRQVFIDESPYAFLVKLSAETKPSLISTTPDEEFENPR